MRTKNCVTRTKPWHWWMLLAVVGFHISWRSDKKLMAVSALSLWSGVT